MDQKTQLLRAYKKEDLLIAASFLRNGELVAVPTETVYGLAADAKNSQAVQKIFVAKDRPTNHPLIVHIASFEKIGYWVQQLPPLAAIVAKHFWPGPITLLFKKADHVSPVVTGGLDTIAIRIPDKLELLELLTMLDTGVAAPSANPHKRISPTTAEHVLESLSGKIAAVLDAGPCGVGVESTILDLTSEVPTILRQGPITQAMLERVLSVPVKVIQHHTSRVAGNMKEHYQPYTKSALMTREQIQRYLVLPEHKDQRCAVMHYSGFENNMTTHVANVIFHKMSHSKDDYARIMYQTLHTLDALGVDIILIEEPPRQDHWGDVWDRLLKATA